MFKNTNSHERGNVLRISNFFSKNPPSSCLFPVKSFTLIELLIVIVIIGVLAVALIPRLKSAQASARDVARLADVKQIQSAIALYHADHGRYPGDIAGNIAGCGQAGILNLLISGGYISSLPVDPQSSKGVPYCYHYNATSSSTPSNWYCNGVRRTSYVYTIFFTLEGANDSLRKATADGSNRFTHCIAGELR